jgi:hypothetical protein
VAAYDDRIGLALDTRTLSEERSLNHRLSEGGENE